MALYAIGDIHGCSKTLDALLDHLAVEAGQALGPTDTLVFVGDYVDRGPDSPGVIGRLIGLEAASTSGAGPACVFLRGNHDQMMIDYIDGLGDVELWWLNGGRATLDAYVSAGYDRVPAEHVAFLRRTRLAFDTPGFTFVHAGLDPRQSVEANLAETNPDVLLWTRAHLRSDLSLWEKPVVVGHTPVAEPVNEPRLLAIDTGAVFVGRPGLGRLTAVRLPERRFLSVLTVD